MGVHDAATRRSAPRLAFASPSARHFSPLPSSSPPFSSAQDAIVWIPGRAVVTLPDRVSPEAAQGRQGAWLSPPAARATPAPIRLVDDVQDLPPFAVPPGRACRMLPVEVAPGLVPDSQSVGSPGTQTPCPGPSDFHTPRQDPGLSSPCADGPPIEDANDLVPGMAGGMLPDRVPPEDNEDHNADSQSDHSLALAPPAPATAPDEDLLASQPGRAAGMLSAGYALVAATARALGVTHDTSDPADSSSSDGEGSSNEAIAFTVDEDCPSDDDRLCLAATELPGQAGYTAVAAATPMPASTAASVSVPLLQLCDNRLGGPACMQPDRVGFDEPTSLVDTALSSAAVLDMVKDVCQRAVTHDVPGPLHEHVQTETGRPDPVLSVYAHNAPAFPCTLCGHTACDMSALSSHRRTSHRGTCFVDHFHSGCPCGIGHRTRAAATKHALKCRDSPSYTPSAARATPGPSPVPFRSRSRSVWSVPEEEVTPELTGSLVLVPSVGTAVASSSTVPTDAATLQSTVPAPVNQAGHLHAPPRAVPFATAVTCSGGGEAAPFKRS
uniref:C2H2-type domain-containing protein n=1 Tax=Peronospora matthiolae TaxID=2874970 RepID=A0AAV1V5G3_9STRA